MARKLLGLNRATLYYRGVGESEENLELMRLIDEQYLRTPFFGSRRVTLRLESVGYQVNRKRVQGLMRTMALKAVYPKPPIRATKTITFAFDLLD